MKQRDIQEVIYTREEEWVRDIFAAVALPIILKSTNQIQHSYGGAQNILRSNCELAYKIADTMMEARKQKPNVETPGF